jgi:hypothetical protein
VDDEKPIIAKFEMHFDSGPQCGPATRPGARAADTIPRVTSRIALACRRFLSAKMQKRRRVRRREKNAEFGEIQRDAVCVSPLESRQTTASSTA